MRQDKLTSSKSIVCKQLELQNCEILEKIVKINKQFQHQFFLILISSYGYPPSLANTECASFTIAIFQAKIVMFGNTITIKDELIIWMEFWTHQRT